MIIEDLGYWNEKLIYEIFEKEEALTICRIPLSRRGIEDKVTWGFTKDVKFSIRSAYHLGMSNQKEKREESSKNSTQKPLWWKVWKLNIPRSTKQFLWRALTTIVPTKQKLFHRKIVNDDLCPICCREAETI